MRLYRLPMGIVVGTFIACPTMILLIQDSITAKMIGLALAISAFAFGMWIIYDGTRS